MHPVLYAQPRPWLLIAFAPAVVGTIVVLLPLALAGLILVMPGLSGLAGLLGLALAWLSLGSDTVSQRRRGTAFFLLVGGLPATLWGIGAFPALASSIEHHHVDWIDGLPVASAGFGVLCLFFLLALRPGGAPPPPQDRIPWRLPLPLVVVALLAAAAGLVAPSGYALVSGGYADDLHAEQGVEARALIDQALRAVSVYRSAHHGAFPADNTSAGLPPSPGLHGRYVQSVTVDHGKVILVYGDDVLARVLGASTAGITLTFTPVEKSGRHVLDREDAHWTCTATGFRGPDDMPVYLGDICC